MSVALEIEMKEMKDHSVLLKQIGGGGSSNFKSLLFILYYDSEFHARDLCSLQLIKHYSFLNAFSPI